MWDGASSYICYFRHMLTIIKQIIDTKKNQCPKQRFATMIEIAKQSKLSLSEIKQELKNLVRSGVLTHGRTINDIYFKIKENE